MKNKSRFNYYFTALTATLLLAGTAARAGETTRVSISSTGTQGNFSSLVSAISANGRYVVFTSKADNLLAGDTNESTDAFVHDRLTGETTRVSVSSAGTQGNGGSYSGGISADGHYVTFTSTASNLVSGDTNEADDVFVHNRMTGETTRVSVSSAGEPGNGGSYSGEISADGRYVAFASTATNLVAGDTNEADDIFVHDRVTGETTRVNVSSAGAQADNYTKSVYPAISADGRYVAFGSEATNLVAGDTNWNNDIFIHNRVTGETMRVNVNSRGNPARRDSRLGVISADGRYVAFDSLSSNLVSGDTNGLSDVFVRDRLLNQAETADLQATMTTHPVSVTKGQMASYSLKVTNVGPDNAHAVNLIDIVANGTVAAITPSKGSCSKAAISVCRFGRLAAGASTTVTVKIKANAHPLKQKVSVNAPPKDNSHGNNEITVSTPVTP